MSAILGVNTYSAISFQVDIAEVKKRLVNTQNNEQKTADGKRSPRFKKTEVELGKRQYTCISQNVQLPGLNMFMRDVLLGRELVPCEPADKHLFNVTNPKISGLWRTSTSSGSANVIKINYQTQSFTVDIGSMIKNGDSSKFEVAYTRQFTRTEDDIKDLKEFIESFRDYCDQFFAYARSGMPWFARKMLLNSRFCPIYTWCAELAAMCYVLNVKQDKDVLSTLAGSQNDSLIHGLEMMMIETKPFYMTDDFFETAEKTINLVQAANQRNPKITNTYLRYFNCYYGDSTCRLSGDFFFQVRMERSASTTNLLTQNLPRVRRQSVQF
ncbi:hypothetical protein [Acrididae reovirus]|nr:hypothetical protein [Acrididae reovirus]